METRAVEILLPVRQREVRTEGRDGKKKKTGREEPQQKGQKVKCRVC